MKRSALDRLSREYHLSEPAIALALDLTGARPNLAAWMAFAIRLLRGAGIAAVAAGIIFFVAANWQDYGLVGRFTVLEAAFAACIGLAFWKPPPEKIGQAGLVLAITLTGALLALFGQSYQGGADLYELFFTWAGLAILFPIAGRSGAVWATWWVVLDIGLGLYCGFIGQDQFARLWLAQHGADRALALLVPAIVNLAGACLFFYLGDTKHAAHAPRWLVRMLATIGFLFGTSAAIAAISRGFWSSGQAGIGAQNAAVIGAYAVTCALLGFAVIRAKLDVYPMALIFASWIAISTVFIATHFALKDISLFLLMPAWLIGTSAAAGFMLMRWVREWRVVEEIA
ncbi:MAG: DUF2157 domain-containing protein [Usitatibacter sp.]